MNDYTTHTLAQLADNQNEKSPLTQRLEGIFGAPDFIKTPREKFNVADYGAFGDGNTLNTEMIQHAINAASAAGGGVVVLNAGTYLSGALFVKSNVELHLQKDATILAIQDDDHYPILPTRCGCIEMDWPAALINFYEVTNASISGTGTIDGNGSYWWKKFHGEDGKSGMCADYYQRGLGWAVNYDCQRVRALVVWKSVDIRLKDITIKRSGFWTVSLTYSERIHVDGISIVNNIGGFGPSTDGIDTDSSCDVLVENCDINCNDDSLCIKSGYGADGLRVNRPAENIVYRNCTISETHSMFTLGSETGGGMRNIEVYGLKMTGQAEGVRDCGIRIKSSKNRGGIMENIHFHDIIIDGARVGFDFILAERHECYAIPKLPSDMPKEMIQPHWKKLLDVITHPELGIPEFRDIFFERIKIRNSRTAITADTYAEKPMQRFVWRDIVCDVEHAGHIPDVDDWTMEEVIINSKDGSHLERVPLFRDEY